MTAIYPPITRTRAYSMNSNIHILQRVKSASAKAGDIPISVRNLLLTIKDIQDTLERWAERDGAASSKDVNDLYIQMMSDYETVVRAFRYHKMDLSELQTFPRQFRSILEHWLSDPTPEHALSTYMPQLRQILSVMLGALDRRRETWKAIQVNRLGTTLASGTGRQATGRM